MERILDHLEERLRALDGALRLRGIWAESSEIEFSGEGENGSAQGEGREET